MKVQFVNAFCLPFAKGMLKTTVASTSPFAVFDGARMLRARCLYPPPPPPPPPDFGHWASGRWQVTAQEVRPSHPSNHRLTGVLFAVALALLVGTAQAQTQARVQQLDILSSNYPYAQGETITVGVLFNQSVTVTGSPILELILDSGTVRMRHTNFISSATRGLTFSYAVQPGDEDPTGISIGANALKLNGGSITDQVGNPVDLNLAGHTINITNDLFDPVHLVDGIPPQVTNLTFTTSPPDHIFAGYPAWYYWMDPDIKVRVDFAEPVTVTGAPILRLDIGERRVMARYDASVHNANDRSVGFAYSVQQGDLDRDGISIAADALVAVGTNTITDALGNRTDDTSLAGHAIHNDPAQRVDAVKPQISGLSIISRPVDEGTYRAGETIQLRVTFDEDLLIHPPSFEEFEPITLDSGVVMAEVTINPQSHDVSGSIYPYHTINEMVLRYTVQAGDYDADGISYLGTPRNGRTIFLAATRFQDLATNLLNIDIPDLIITNAEGHKVDGGGPRVTRVAISRGSRPPNGPPYRAGEVISVLLYFNQTIVGDLDNLRLTLNLDSAAVVSQQPDFPPSSLNRYAFFPYTVQDGDLDQDGISIAADALSLTSGSVTNAAGTPLILSLAGHTITNDGEHKVDAAAPKVVDLSIISTPADGEAYRVGERIRIQLTLDEPVMPFAQPTLSIPLLIGEVRHRLTHQVLSPSNVLIATYQVHGGLDEDGISVGQGGLEVAGGSLTDAVGNPLELSLAGHIITNDPEHKVGAVPRFTAADALPEQTYTVGQPVRLPLPQAIGGVAPLRYELRGDLPPGLAFDADTRILSGTPNAPVDAAELQLVVTDALPSFGILPPFRVTVVAAPSFTGISVDEQIYTATAAIPDLLLPAPNHGARPLSYTLVPVPEGLSFDRETRTLSGTPTLPAAITELELTATGNNGASDRLRFRVTVAKPPRFVSEVEDMLIRAKRHTVPMILPHAEDGHGSFTYNLQERRDGSLRNLPEYTLFDPASRELKIYSEVRVYTLVYTATDTNGAVATQDFIVTATKPQLPPALGYTFDRGVPITPVVLPAATGGIGEVTYSFSGPSLGFKFDPDTRIMSGTPRIASADLPDTYFLYYYSAQDEAGGGGTTQLHIRVRENSVFPPYIPMYFDPPLSGDLLITRGIAFERVFPEPMGGTGANPLFNYSTHFESLPQGIQFERYTRRLHGTAAQVTSGGGYPFRYTVADVGSVREQIVAHLKIKVVEQPSFDEPLRLSLRQNERLPDAPAEQITLPAAIDGAPPLVYTLEGGMPPGLAFDAATRALSGTPTEDGASTLIYTATDANGAVASGDFVFTVVDTVRPEVTGLAIISTPSRDTAPYDTAPQDTYLLGERIRMRLDFSEPVLVAADVSPKPILHLNLEIGSTDIPIQFHFPADSNAPVMALEGSYQVQEGDLDEDGISSSQLFLAGVPAEITDAAGNELDLHAPGLPTNPTHKVDGVVPKVSLVLVRRSPANHDTYRLGEEIKVLIAFDSLFPLSLGQLSLQLTLDSGVVTARNSGTHQGIGSHGRGFDFSYVVQAGDGDENGISLGADALMLVAGEIITDDSGNPVNLSLVEFAFNDDPRYKVDTAAPRVTAMSVISTPRLAGHYSAGERITARVDFNEPVAVADGTTPILQMSLGDDAPLVAMEYEVTQPGDASLLFGYTVQAGDEDNDGIGIGADALSVTDGNLTDTIGNPAANLDLTAFAFENDSEHKVDGVGPQVTNVSIISAPEQFGYYAAGERITARVDFNEPVTVVDGTTPVLQMSLGDVSPRLVAMEYETAQAGDDSMLFGYTVQTDDEDHNGIGIAADALEVTGGSLTDTLGNPAADLGLTAFAIENDPQHKVDGVVPDITAPADMTFEATAVMTPLTADDYDSATSTDGTADISNNAPLVFPLGETPIIWTATDPAGNEMMDTQVVTVVDTTKPVIVLLGDNPQTVEFGTAYTELNATATDEVDDDIKLTARIVADASTVDTGTVGDYTVTYTVSDTATNVATPVTRMVTVTDTTAPDISPPADITFEATDTLTPLGRTHYGTATSPDREAMITDDAPLAFSVGVHTITWRATDTNALFSTADQTITITDTTKPDIAAPENITKEATGPTTPVTVGLATATDLVTDPVTITRTPTGNDFTVGTHTITWKADDGNGNIITAEQTITITDTTKPSIALLGDNPQTVEFGSIYTDPDATATDLVDDDIKLTEKIHAASTVNTGTVGDYTVTYTVSDKATNAATPVTRMVTVEDTAAPDISPPDTYTTEATATLTPLDRTDYGIATSTDGRADITDDAPDAFPLGDTTITWTATDKSNNEARATQVVTVQDTTKPVIALLDDNPQTVEFGTAYTELNATATDEVDDDDELTRRIVIDANAVDVNLIGTYPVTYDVSDAEGNPADTVTRMVMVTDTVIPDIIAPNTYTTEATATLTPLDRTDYGIATSTDGNADITDDAPDAFPLGDTPITWRATDINSLFSTAAQTITITDTTKPDIAAPENITEEATAPTTPVTVGLATATDLVTDPVIITRTPEADAFAVGTHTITWKADDGNGNIITAAQTITITDTTKPVITLTNDNADSNTVELGSAYTEYGATATDAVDDNTELTRRIAINAGAVDVDRLGTYPVTYDVSDTEGNPAERVTRMVTVTDTEAPDIIAPADMTFEATDTLTPLDRSDYGTATSGDDTADITDDAPDAFPLGATTITWTATDPATNEMMATQMVTIVDTTKPVIALLGADPQTVEFGTTYTELNATATDEVDDDDELTRRIVIDANAVDVDLIGTYPVTYDVTDAEGNAADRVTRMVMVTDTVIPDITAPLAITFEATDTLTPLSRSDYGTATSGDDTADITDDAPDAFPLGATTITWTATDPATNEMIATQVVTIVDTTKPVIALLGADPQTVEFGTTYTELNATATDEVDDDIKLTARIVADASTVDTGTVGDYTVTYTVSDKATNAATPVLRMVTVTDTAAPTITAPADITLEATDTLTPLGRTHYGTATSTDREAMITDDAPLAFPVGVHTITWTATDTNTLFSTAAQTITITDTTKPDITAPGNITEEATGPTTPVTVGLATATDLVTDPVIITRSPEGNEFAVGTHTITWKADDGNGNIITAAQTITITDTTKPVIALLGDNPQTVEFGSTYNDPGATATDAVDDNTDLTTQISAASTVNTGTVGDYTVTYTVSDKATNAATPVIRMVIVTDTAAPDITAPADITFEATDTLTPLGRTHYGTATSSDREAMITDDAPLAFSVGVHTITWTATDTNTLFSTAAQTITITDTTAPDITAPGNIIKEATAPTTPVTVGQATATDLVTDPVIITRSPEAEEFAVGTHTITWKADDGNGNIITAAQTVTITDTTKPVIALLGADPQTVEFGSVYTDPGATATDAVDDNDVLTTQIAAASTVNTGTVGDYKATNVATVTYTVHHRQPRLTAPTTNVATPVPLGDTTIILDGDR